MDEIVNAVKEGVAGAFRDVGFNRAGNRAVVPETETQLAAPPASVDLSAERRALDAERETLAAERLQLTRDKFWARAESEVHTLLAAGKVRPAQNQPTEEGQQSLVALFAQALADDAVGSPVFGVHGGSRYEALRDGFGRAARQADTEEQIEVSLLTVPERTPRSNPSDPEKIKRLLAMTPVGQKTLRNAKNGA